MNAESIFEGIPSSVAGVTPLPCGRQAALTYLHSRVNDKRDALEAARELVETTPADVRTVSNRQAKRELVAGLGPVTYPVKCPRCLSRGRDRLVGHPDDWEACHPPFAKRLGGFSSQSTPRDWYALGCRTCNMEDPDHN